MRRSIIPMVILSSLSSLGVGLLGPVYPIFIVNRFSAALADMGILSALFCTVTALPKVPSRKLMDRYGGDKVFFAGVMGGAACTLLYLLANGLGQLYVIVLGIGISTVMQRQSLLLLTANASGKEKRGLFLSMFESAGDFAQAAAALLAVAVVSRYGFESLLFICSGCQATTGLLFLKSGSRLH